MDEGWAARQTGTRNMKFVTTMELSADNPSAVSLRSKTAPVELSATGLFFIRKMPEFL